MDAVDISGEWSLTRRVWSQVPLSMTETERGVAEWGGGGTEELAMAEGDSEPVRVDEGESAEDESRLERRVPAGA